MSSVATKSTPAASRRVLDFAMNNVVWFLLVAAIAIMGLFRPSFYSFGILSNILVQATVLGLLAIAISMIIVLGDINLATVGTAGFSALTGVLLIKAGFPVLLSIVVIVLVGGLIGLLTGLIVTKLKANSLITTLAVNMVLQGAILAITRGASISNLPPAYKFVSQGRIAGLPALPLVLIVAFVVFHLIWTRTSFGRALFAVGGNARAAYIAGIGVDRVKIWAYVVSGLLSGVAGWLLSCSPSVFNHLSTPLVLALAAVAFFAFTLLYTAGLHNIVWLPPAEHPNVSEETPNTAQEV